MVGRSLSCDDLTLGCKRLDFARLCEEVDATLSFIHTFKLELCNETKEVHLQYEWKPKRCEKCQVDSCAQPLASKQVVSNVQPSTTEQIISDAQPSATKQVISDAQPTQKVRDDKLPNTNSDEFEGLDGSYDSEGSNGSYESKCSDGLDESSLSAPDSSIETHLRPSDVGDVRTLPLESLLCTTSKQMSPPPSPETRSTLS
ncbi:hypothetical protein SADUNF_Sadunf01G0189700 [Salix dunnii]|uniref:Uncharacterized protein n=1 Tax=Salix dunnii TaxID=1413687 RepID=A0A835ND83_9ROSI|nr:hypothetical protein SADUNF_Sadunf01G0189700 [Salix dunnii]